MSIPTTTKVFRRSNGEYPRFLELSTEEIPPLQEADVLLRIHAVTLNYRDIAMLEEGKYPRGSIEKGIPASDCAAEVIAVGPAVANFEIGDRVSPLFDLESLTGTEVTGSALGGNVDGVLCEYRVINEQSLVRIPKHLSWEEAACIPCAGVTAWTGLGIPSIRPGGSALLQGTGGVSTFGLLLCLAAGVVPIITSSSDEKLEKLRALAPPGAIKTINYKTTPAWDEEAKKLTGGRGVDVALENVGISTLVKSISSLGRRGVVSFIGFLGGLKANETPDIMTPLKMKGGTIRCIMVGSKIDMQELCQFIEDRQVQLTPLLDKTFSFEDSQAAFDYLKTGTHSGKVVIKM